eukprot:m.141276 g.141276  ORF g.141276 m.141276 type:complete len:57 (+) comp38337_c0_seq9:1292-1462(+)
MSVSLLFIFVWLDPDDKAAMQSFLEELKMLTSLGEHKHVVKVFGFSWQHEVNMPIT